MDLRLSAENFEFRPKRKKELLLHFGTTQKIKSASLEDLKAIKSIPIKKNLKTSYLKKSTITQKSRKQSYL